MNKIYLLLFFLAVVFGAYICGGRVEREKCKGNVAGAMLASQIEFIKLQEDVNAEVFGRGGDDIRRILREKYTIVE